MSEGVSLNILPGSKKHSEKGRVGNVESPERRLPVQRELSMNRRWRRFVRRCRGVSVGFGLF